MLRTSIVTMLTASLAVLTCLWFFPLMRVSGESMAPALSDKQLVVLMRFAFLWHSPQHGDKVAAQLPGSGQKVVKRVVLIPGEPLVMNGGQLVLGSRLLPLNAEQRQRLAKYSAVPADSYFVLGDNKQHSLDSRDFGFVLRKNMQGKVLP